MLTLTEQTAKEVGSNWADDDDARWRGAARKYLATVAGRTYLVKPDVGWPSDRDSERVAAAYYRRLNQPVPNVVNATIGGVNACAVRIIPNADPIGDGFSALTNQESRDVFRGLLLSSLIGDRDRHQYNWIADGTRAYAIDHGLAFARMDHVRISAFATEYVYTMLDEGTLTVADMMDIVETLPTNAPEVARMAWAHVQRFPPTIPDDVRTLFREYVEAIAVDRVGGSVLTSYDWFSGWTPDADEDEYDDEPECDCSMCMPRSDDEPSPDSPPAPAMRRNVMRCGFGAPQYAPRPHHHQWTITRGWHSTAATPVIRFYCVCQMCERPAGRQYGKECASGRVFPRKVDDIRRNRYLIHVL